MPTWFDTCHLFVKVGDWYDSHHFEIDMVVCMCFYFVRFCQLSLLREGLGLDSVDVVSIVSQIERRFRIRLTQQELEKLVSVADVLDLLETKFTGGAETSAA